MRIYPFMQAEPALSGAEHLLARQAETTEVADGLLARIGWWRNHAGSDPGGITSLRAV